MKPSPRPFVSLCLLTFLLAACSHAPTASTSNGSGSGSGSGTGSGSGSGGTGTGSTGPFTIGGTVLGLSGTGLVLEDNGGDDLTIAGTGTVTFTFKTAVASTYNVIVKTQPGTPTQTCSVSNGTGTATGNVTNIQVVCAATFNVGGTISGLLGSGLTLQNNGGDNLVASGTGNVNFAFATPLLSGAAYAVTILKQPVTPVQTCTVLNGTGTISGSVNNVQVVCSQPAFSIGGAVVGLVTGSGDTLELQNNAGDNLFVTGDTTFTFPTPVTNGGIYNVSLFLPPTSQTQPCNLFNWNGTATGNVSNVLVDCQHNDWNWISWYIAKSNVANQYATVTTPRHPGGQLPPANLSNPGGRDFAATWTDKTGRKWLFGGFGYAFPSPYGSSTNNTPPGLLNDLWVFDGTWTPANVGTFVDTAGNFEDDTTTLQGTNVGGGYPGSVGSAGTPGSRWGSATWIDGSGNLWMFGGQGYDSKTLATTLLNDMWECTPAANPTSGAQWQAGTLSCPWIWQGPVGSNVGNQKGVYTGTAIPGGRWGSATFVDSAGHLWLFGGQGYDSTGTVGLLNDLWEYTPSTNTWTWVSPTNSNLGNQKGVYGTQGTAGAGNYPGGRQSSVLWVDSTGVVWLFGGFGLDSAGTNAPEGAVLNDLWKYSGGQWTWVSGGNVGNQNGVYGTQTQAAAGNVPGSMWGSVGWTDASNNLWFFGGWGYDSNATHGTGFLNDVWEYQHSTGQWIWWKGASAINQNGQYLTDGIPYVNNIMGARRGTAIWQPDSNGYVWLFGGEGFDSTQGAPPGYLSDMWTYLPFP